MLLGLNPGEFASPSKGFKSIQYVTDNKIRVTFNEIIGLYRIQSGTLGAPTSSAILSYGKKGVHFIPAKPF